MQQLFEHAYPLAMHVLSQGKFENAAAALKELLNLLDDDALPERVRIHAGLGDACAHLFLGRPDDIAYLRQALTEEQWSEAATNYDQADHLYGLIEDPEIETELERIDLVSKIKRDRCLVLGGRFGYWSGRWTRGGRQCPDFRRFRGYPAIYYQPGD